MASHGNRLLRLRADLTQASINRPYLAIQIIPCTSITLDWISSASFNEAYSRFGRHQNARRFGFNLDWEGSFESIGGGGLRKVRDAQMSVSLQIDGLFTSILGPEYLFWGMEKYFPSAAVLNPFAIIEYVTESLRFFHEKAIPLASASFDISLIFEGFSDGSRIGLAPGVPGLHSDLVSLHTITEDRTSFEVNLPRLSGSPEHLALLVIQHFYREFGLFADAIPFRNEDGTAIDRALIARTPLA